MFPDHVIVEHSRGFYPIVRGPGNHGVIDGLHVARAEHVSK